MLRIALASFVPSGDEGIGAPRFAPGRVLAFRVRRNLTEQMAHEVPSTRADELEVLRPPKTR